MRIQASSVSSATTASTSPRSKASAKRVSTSRSAGESGNVPPTDRSGAASSAARARCSALVTDGLAGAEHLRHLGRAVAEHVAQHEHGALTGRHALEPGDEGQAHGLPGLVAGVGAVGAVGQALEQRVGVGLQPDRLAPARRLRLGRAAGGRHVRPAGVVAQRVEAAVGGDPVQPGAQRGAALEARQPAPGGQQRLLDEVLGVLHRAEDPVAVHLQLAPVRVGQGPEGLLVARPRALERRLGHVWSSHGAGPPRACEGNDTARAPNSSVDPVRAPVSERA